ncbi:Protein of unknown function [Pyronema omphalodes CBS 100304]|uniref:Uncharacterized protein n=1 Tax=Pyronema omphalodes (strain CBS 100304) TaxID=1076935 RepID=U4L917_PYROM|nr:Protein of unknown function [Pyronema omphalodes CBS 100304]
MANLLHKLLCLQLRGENVLVCLNRATLSWIAAFAHKVMGLKVIFQRYDETHLELTPLEKQQKRYGTIHLVLEHDFMPRQRSVKYELKVLVPCRIRLELHKPDIDQLGTSYRVPVHLICKRKLEEITSSHRIQALIIEHIAFHFYHSLLYGEIVHWHARDKYASADRTTTKMPFMIAYARKALNTIAPGFTIPEYLPVNHQLDCIDSTWSFGPSYHEKTANLYEKCFETADITTPDIASALRHFGDVVGYCLGISL